MMLLTCFIPFLKSESYFQATYFSLYLYFHVPGKEKDAGRSCLISEIVGERPSLIGPGNQPEIGQLPDAIVALLQLYSQFYSGNLLILVQMFLNANILAFQLTQRFDEN